MCGICGKLNFDAEQPVEAGLIQRMMGLLQHRGPDGAGEFRAGPVGLGHRRLSIIDLDTGAQPMSNEDGTIWLVYNGEIYNFEELREELVRRGHRFKSSSDTEVIVHMYEEMGDRCVTRFRGMFAFTLWDQRQRRLLLARDRVGIKPLYYVDTGRSIVFGSEIKALLADAEVKRRIDMPAIERFLTYYYLPGERTLLAGVRKLEPGHYLTVENGRIDCRRYWDLEFSVPPPSRTLADTAEALRELLSRTVREHMISDVPVGVLLSGGLDSTGILEFASRHASGRIHSFTMGFSGDEVPDERPFARVAADAFGSEHHETTMSAADFRDFLPRYVWHMEEPVCEPPAVALYFTAHLAQTCGVKVLLSGEGGDEAFAGYQDYRNVLALEALKSTAGPAKGLLGSGFRLLDRAGWSRGRHYAELVELAFPDYYLSRTATPETPFNRRRKSLYRDAFLAQLDAGGAAGPTRRLLDAVAGQTLLNRMLYVDTKTWLPDDLLVKADKMTMATSVELRVPLLDHEVLEFAASLPRRHKVRGWDLKRVLREALSPGIPKQILHRKKAGFPVPYSRWMRRELKEFVHDTILQKGSLVDSCLSREGVEQLLLEHDQHGRCAKEVFSLVVLNLWHEHFYRSPALLLGDAEPSDAAVPQASDLSGLAVA
jgi:asparagine synthase (glutamine-hydrolysing)